MTSKILKNRFVRSYFMWIGTEYNQILDTWRYRIKNQWIRILLLFIHPVIIFGIFGGWILLKTLEMLYETYITVKLLLAWITIMILTPWSIASYLLDNRRIKK